ncbi:hypothetical protein BHE74_00003471 [Ensete ventricosum]|nr:hypothetical protein BHE74_00003471 [Ensete ventricosum]
MMIWCREHKIWDGAYSLLHSSGTIGRVCGIKLISFGETFKERRFRAVQLSKAGLEVPEDILPFKEKHHPNVFNDDEAALEVETIQSLRNDVGVDITLPEKVMKIDDNNHNLSIDVPLPSPKARENNMSASAIADQKCSSTTAGYDGYDNLAQVGIGIHVISLCFYVPHPLPDFLSVAYDNMLGYSDKKYQEIEGITDLTVQEHVNATTVVHISRPREVEEHRKDLPIIMMEQEIMEAINEHFIVILCGETGCGKTTQVPQFLYEAGFGSSLHSDRKGIIGVTQPRRVAVLATAKRVSFELGLGLGKEVGFQVRHDKLIGKSCSIKFMTDGILLREVQVLE